MRNIADFIVVANDMVPLDLCDAIVQEYGDKDGWVNASVNGGVVNKNIRSCEYMSISDEKSIEKNPIVRQNIDKRLFNVAGQALNYYRTMFPSVDACQDSGYDLLRYNEGGFYTQHIDDGSKTNRSISLSFTVSDGYEGGEWGFFDRKLVLSPVKGSVVMFPSNFMYTHEIMPVTKGVRYSIITWFA